MNPGSLPNRPPFLAPFSGIAHLCISSLDRVFEIFLSSSPVQINENLKRAKQQCRQDHRSDQNMKQVLGNLQ